MFSLVLLTASAFVSVSAYKNGAPTFLCAGTFNRPVHGTNLPSNKPSPYKFVVNTTGVYRPSEPVSSKLLLLLLLLLLMFYRVSLFCVFCIDLF